MLPSSWSSGPPKKHWFDLVQDDIHAKGLVARGAQDWVRLSRIADLVFFWTGCDEQSGCMLDR